MSSHRAWSVLFVVLGALACSSGGLEYWLYPAPRLEPAAEALFVTYEDHRVVSIDSDETAIRCFGDLQRMGAQAYRQVNRRPCRLHIRPGPHEVVFETSLNGERMVVEFTAEAGKAYGLNWSDCRARMIAVGNQRTCNVQVVEVEIG